MWNWHRSHPLCIAKKGFRWENLNGWSQRDATIHEVRPFVSNGRTNPEKSCVPLASITFSYNRHVNCQKATALRRAVQWNTFHCNMHGHLLALKKPLYISPIEDMLRLGGPVYSMIVRSTTNRTVNKPMVPHEPIDESIGRIINRVNVKNNYINLKLDYHRLSRN